LTGLPQAAFLLSIVGLSVSLAGFTGLVAALRRGAAWKPMDSYRLRQIPEMALATGFIALSTIPLADTTGSASVTIRIAGGVGLLFVIANALVLIERARSMNVRVSGIDGVLAGTVNLVSIAVAVAALVAPTSATLEWLLALLIARPGLAFLLALSDLMPE